MSGNEEKRVARAWTCRDRGRRPVVCSRMVLVLPSTDRNVVCRVQQNSGHPGTAVVETKETKSLAAERQRNSRRSRCGEEIRCFEFEGSRRKCEEPGRR